MGGNWRINKGNRFANALHTALCPEAIFNDLLSKNPKKSNFFLKIFIAQQKSKIKNNFLNKSYVLLHWLHFLFQVCFDMTPTDHTIATQSYKMLLFRKRFKICECPKSGKICFSKHFLTLSVRSWSNAPLHQIWEENSKKHGFGT